MSSTRDKVVDLANYRQSKAPECAADDPAADINDALNDYDTWYSRLSQLATSMDPRLYDAFERFAAFCAKKTGKGTSDALVHWVGDEVRLELGRLYGLGTMLILGSTSGFGEAERLYLRFACRLTYDALCAGVRAELSGLGCSHGDAAYDPHFGEYGIQVWLSQPEQIEQILRVVVEEASPELFRIGW